MKIFQHNKYTDNLEILFYLISALFLYSYKINNLSDFLLLKLVVSILIICILIKELYVLYKKIKLKKYNYKRIIYIILLILQIILLQTNNYHYMLAVIGITFITVDYLKKDK